MRCLDGISPRDIVEKFRTAFDLFMAGDFGSIFNDPAYPIQSVRAWLVSDLFRGLPTEKVREKEGTTRLKYFQTVKPFELRGQPVWIRLYYATDTPEVCSC